MSHADQLEQTPSPVRAVRQFEADELLAKQLQQTYEDEAKAAELEEELDLADEFDAVTRATDDAANIAASEKVLATVREAMRNGDALDIAEILPR